VKDNACSVPIVQVSPRISMIAAIDTDGNTYFSLTQTNSNSKVMEIFFKQLVQKLDKEHLNWRKSHIIMLDNAPYHNSEHILKVLDDYSIPVIFTGPHSYDAAPIELWFARFKSVNINPECLPMGKL